MCSGNFIGYFPRIFFFQVLSLSGELGKNIASASDLCIKAQGSRSSIFSEGPTRGAEGSFPVYFGGSEESPSHEKTRDNLCLVLTARSLVTR